MHCRSPRAIEASVADWPLEDIARWQQTGISLRGTAFGPMAEIVFQTRNT